MALTMPGALRREIVDERVRRAGTIVAAHAYRQARLVALA